MKLSSYIVRVDSGFAPNPFGGYCTLACCKPGIRKHAEVGDIVIGTGRVASKAAGKLIYAMKVDDILTLEEYSSSPSFQKRKPNRTTVIGLRGDNIWYRKNEKWRCLPGALHDERHMKRDIGGKNVLVSKNFFYFGKNAIELPPQFKKLIASTQGYKNSKETDIVIVKNFWKWLSRVAPKKGLIGLPSEYTKQGCDTQCAAIETTKD